ncbi:MULTISPECIES: 2-keto-4-pentenoate hydratase [Achromobacter]|uniref:2-keto-4-pentenoate hydratase n=1 Tax=Achromobacter piechaudii TaxID=72556 RepID=A0A6S7E5E6_9BURK|nr:MULTISPECIES: fumarylacetoacetate hydrolase family protein [Achromobacter]MPS81379.1 hydratase [Achromobacter sp.]CAB3896437.1 2-keto-4-pentenoate hydratase [Achromobacter piechaudii]
MQIRIEDYPGSLDAARTLIAARESGVAGPRLPADCRPQSMAQAFAVQQRTAQLLQEMRQDGITAWKSALPSPEKTVVAPIYASGTAYAEAGPVATRTEIVRVEPEIAFELARDLPARDTPYTEAEVDAAVGSARLALEILGCRYASPEHASLPELLADHMFNEGLVLGPRIASPDAAPTNMTLTLSIAGREVEQHPGFHPNERPKAGLYWLANFLREQGLGLHAGQHVITGSYAGFLDVPAHQDIELIYGDLGVLRVRFGS